MSKPTPPSSPASNRPNAQSGLFIAFEGVEGGGKTTQIAALAEWLKARGRQVLLTREPGGTPIGAQIRQVLLTPENKGMSHRAELLLYAADRAHHVDRTIRPALEAGTDVLTDRYLYSTVAYQGYGRGLSLDEIHRLNSYATSNLLPDLVIVLDLDPAVGLQRAKRVGAPDRLEQEALAFHERVRRGFLEQARQDPARFIVISADQPPQTVSKWIIEQVAERCAIVP